MQQQRSEEAQRQAAQRRASSEARCVREVNVGGHRRLVWYDRHPHHPTSVRSKLTPACADENVSRLVGIGAELIKNLIVEERVRLGDKNGAYMGNFIVSVFGASTGSKGFSIEQEGNSSGTTLTLTPCLCPQYSILTPACRPH